MGGLGSGRWGYSASRRTTTDDVKHLDIRYLKRNHLLENNTVSTLRWSTNGNSENSIRLLSLSNKVTLSYSYRMPNNDWQSVQQDIRLVHTPCHLGNTRPWFACPSCGKRVALLFYYETRFKCRQCHSLRFASQTASYLERIIDQKHKLGQRIFQHYEYGDGWGKKPHMHWKTFNKQLHRYNYYDSIVTKQVDEKMEALTHFMTNRSTK